MWAHGLKNAPDARKTTWGSRVHTHTAVFFYSVAVGPRGGAGLYVVHRAKPCANVAGGVSLLLVLERATQPTLVGSGSSTLLVFYSTAGICVYPPVTVYNHTLKDCYIHTIYMSSSTFSSTYLSYTSILSRTSTTFIFNKNRLKNQLIILGPGFPFSIRYCVESWR